MRRASATTGQGEISRQRAGLSARALRRRSCLAFTLLEMCIVLLIIGILAGAAMPAFESAVNEHHLREDSHQLALMVRIAMLQTAEQRKPFVMDLTKNSMALHPLGEVTEATLVPDAALFGDGASTNSASADGADVATPTVEMTKQLENPNKLLVPDPVKVNAWIDAPEGTQWVFHPGELCPATKVRLARGDAWIEVTFAALTGDVDKEQAYLP